MLEAKAKYRTVHPGAPVERVLGHAETVSRLGQSLAPLANPLLRRPGLRRLGEAVLGVDRRRTMAPFARRTFAEMLELHRDRDCGSGCFAAYSGHLEGALPVAAGAAAGRAAASPAASPGAPSGASRASRPAVAYFYDLFANYNDPGLAVTVVRTLEAHGVRVLVPRQKAAGIPEMLYGYARDAASIARSNLEGVLPAIGEGAVLVSAEPTATFAFKVHYPDYAPGRDCSLVADATRDLGEFLLRHRADHPEVSPVARSLRDHDGAAAAGRAIRVAYHQPCHLKAQQIGNPGLELLQQIPGIEVIDLAAGCCGMAGTFGMKAGTYDFSMLVGEPLFRRVAEIAPDMIATECSTCRMQISEATGLETVHPVTLLAEAYGV
jgi:Fe-S oxidoreductase